MGAILKVVIVAVLVLFAVGILGTVAGTYDSPASSAQLAIEQMDMAPRTVGSVDGSWRQSDVFRVLIPTLLSGGTLLGFTWPSPAETIVSTFVAAFGIISLVLLVRLIVKLLTAG